MNKNKGFSLVELIVVVAIMAVLVGILAPAYLSYVEKTRRGTDENMVEEIRHTVEVATADICVYDEVVGKMGASGTTSITFGATGSIANCGTQIGTEMKNALEDVYGTKTFDTKSKKYNGKQYEVTIKQQGSSSGSGTAMTVEGKWK